MKQFLLSLSFIAITFTSQAQDFKTPVDYLNFVGKETENISANTWKYTKAVAHSKRAKKIDATRKDLLKSIQAAAKKIEAAKEGYKGDTEYRDQLLAYLSISEKYINEEYDKIINMQEVAEQSYDFMEAYITARDLVNEKINAEIDKLNENQKTFAAKYGIQITENNSKLAKNMEISNQVFGHQSDMYLLFFKVYITDTNMMKAIEANDLNSIQQNASALEQFANEGLEKIKTFTSYKNDPLLSNATKKVLEFYKKEAVEFAPGTVEFLMMKQKIEETDKSIKSKSSPTKDEIAAFNKLVTDYNKLTGNYNKLNNKFFQDKNNAINAWNEASETYISKHVPKD
jgi:hypothetical protein